MKFGKLLNALPKIIEAKIVPIIVGVPGVGKSQGVEEVVKEKLQYDFEVFHPAMGMPSDIKGLPFKKSEDEAGFLPYDLMAKIRKSTKPLVVLIDDVIQSTQLMQASIMQLIESRTINGERIPDHVRFIVCTNKGTHGAGGSRIITPLVGRSIVLEAEVDPKAWIKWGIETKRICAEVLFYIQTYPEALSEFTVPADIQNVPSPRNWERVSKLIEIGIDENEFIAGCVGETEAIRFTAFLKTISELKGVIPQIIKTPETAPVFCQETELDKLYSLGLALAHNAKDGNFRNIYKYLNRINGEAKEFILANILQFHPNLKETDVYIKHVTKREPKA